MSGLELVLPISETPNDTVLSANRFEEQMGTAAGKRKFIKICRALFKESCHNLAEYIHFSPWQIDSDWYKNIPPYALQRVSKNYKIDVPYYCTGKGERATQFGATALYNWRDRRAPATVVPNASEQGLLVDLNRLKRQYHLNICKQNILMIYLLMIEITRSSPALGNTAALSRFQAIVAIIQTALPVVVKLAIDLKAQLKTDTFEDYLPPTIWGFFHEEEMCDKADTLDPTEPGWLSRMFFYGWKQLEASQKVRIMTPKEVRQWERRPGEPEWAQYLAPHLRKFLNPAAFPPAPSGPVPDNCRDKRSERNGGPWVGGRRRRTLKCRK